MGGKTTKLFRNSTPSGFKAQDENDSQCDKQLNDHNNQNNQQPEEPIVKNQISPFVHYRRG